MSTSTNSAEILANNVTSTINISPVKSGEALNVGDGFAALAFRDKDFNGAMDPLVMVDHYTMTKPTFGPHPHAGLSAVSVILEDSEGPFHNRDSLGNDFDIMPGDLYWLNAGSGAIHDESPRVGSKIHGLQVFVNLPAKLRKNAPKSLHVKAEDMPHIKCEGSRVRVVLGQSNGVISEQPPALPMTILDGTIHSNTTFSHTLEQQENAWITVVSGELHVLVGGQQERITSGQAIAITADLANGKTTVHLVNPSAETTQFVLFAGTPIKEKYVQKGPFIMGSEAEIAQIEKDFSAGKLGKLV